MSLPLLSPGTGHSDLGLWQMRIGRLLEPWGLPSMRATAICLSASKPMEPSEWLDLSCATKSCLKISINRGT